MMNTRMIRRLIVALWTTFAFVFAAHAADQSADQSTLYYLVVDSSGSIESRKFTEKIKEAIKKTLDQIASNNRENYQKTSVRLLLFSSRDKLLPLEGKEPFDDSAKDQLWNEFNKKYEPRGLTALFYTADRVFNEVWNDREKYSRIDIVFLTDGVDEEKSDSNKKIIPQFYGCTSFDDVIKRLPEEIQQWLKQKKSDNELETAWVFLGEKGSSSPLPPDGFVKSTWVGDINDLIKDPILIPKPNAAFSMNPTTLEVNQEVMVALQNQGGVKKVVWNFGDDTPTVSTEKPEPVKHQYVKAGVFTITVTVSGVSGDSSAEATITVSQVELNADFSMNPTMPEVNQEVMVALKNQSGVQKVEWNFGDGTPTVTTEKPEPVRHQYAKAGEYTISVKVSGVSGEKKESKKIKVSQVELNADFSMNPTKLEVNQEVMVALQDQGGVQKVEWNFGDGTPTVTTEKPEPVRHQYAKDGEYTISVKVSGVSGEKKESKKIKVLPVVNLEADFSFPNKIRLNEPVQFVDKSLGSPEQYAWDIPKLGMKSAERNPNFMFPSAGEYKVALTVTRNGKNPNVKEMTVKVLPELPDAKFTVDPLAVDLGKKVQIKAASTMSGWTHSWAVGAQKFTGPEIEWEAKDQKPGPVEIQHTVVNSAGESVNETGTLFINNPDADADFSVSPEDLIAGTEITITPKADTAGTKHTWIIEGKDNGVKLTGDKATFRGKLEKSGDYTITHEVVNPSGKQNSLFREYIVYDALEASFSIQTPPEDRKIGVAIGFVDASKGKISQYSWDFGDGTNAVTSKNATHVYNEEKKYTVTHTVIDSKGNKRVSSQEIEIVSAIQAAFSVDRTKGEIPPGTHPFVVQMKNESTRGDYTYTWNFGDGTPESNELEPRHEYKKAGNYQINLTIKDNSKGFTRIAAPVEIRIAPSTLLYRCLIATAVIACILFVFWMWWLINRPPPVKKCYILGKGKLGDFISIGPARKQREKKYQLKFPLTPKLTHNFAQLQRSLDSVRLTIKQVNGKWDISCQSASLNDTLAGLGVVSPPMKDKITVSEGQTFEHNGYPYVLHEGKPLRGWRIIDTSNGGLGIQHIGRRYSYNIKLRKYDKMSLTNGDILYFGELSYRFEFDNATGTAKLVREGPAPVPWWLLFCVVSVVLLIIPMSYYAYELFV